MIPFLLVEATVCSVFFHECEAEGVETKAIVESTCTSAIKRSTTFNIARNGCNCVVQRMTHAAIEPRNVYGPLARWMGKQGMPEAAKVNAYLYSFVVNG